MNVCNMYKVGDTIRFKKIGGPFDVNLKIGYGIILNGIILQNKINNDLFPLRLNVFFPYGLKFGNKQKVKLLHLPANLEEVKYFKILLLEKKGYHF